MYLFKIPSQRNIPLFNIVAEGPPPAVVPIMDLLSVYSWKHREDELSVFPLYVIFSIDPAGTGDTCSACKGIYSIPY